MPKNWCRDLAHSLKGEHIRTRSQCHAEAADVACRTTSKDDRKVCSASHARIIKKKSLLHDLFVYGDDPS